MARTRTAEDDRRDVNLSNIAESAAEVSADVIRDANRVALAWAEATTEFWVGSLEVFSDLMRNVNDTLSSRTRERDPEKKGKRKDATDYARDYADTASDVTKHLRDAFEEQTRIMERSVDTFQDKVTVEGKGKTAANHPGAKASEPHSGHHKPASS